MHTVEHSQCFMYPSNCRLQSTWPSVTPNLLLTTSSCLCWIQIQLHLIKTKQNWKQTEKHNQAKQTKNPLPPLQELYFTYENYEFSNLPIFLWQKNQLKVKKHVFPNSLVLPSLHHTYSKFLPSKELPFTEAAVYLWLCHVLMVLLWFYWSYYPQQAEGLTRQKKTVKMFSGILCFLNHSWTFMAARSLVIKTHILWLFRKVKALIQMTINSPFLNHTNYIELVISIITHKL